MANVRLRNYVPRAELSADVRSAITELVEIVKELDAKMDKLEQYAGNMNKNLSEVERGLQDLKRQPKGAQK